jgi:hypothetical protein
VVDFTIFGGADAETRNGFLSGVSSELDDFGDDVAAAAASYFIFLSMNIPDVLNYDKNIV